MVKGVLLFNGRFEVREEEMAETGADGWGLDLGGGR